MHEIKGLVATLINWYIIYIGTMLGVMWTTVSMYDCIDELRGKSPLAVSLVSLHCCVSNHM